jgi:hypothetical protein
MLRVGTHPGCFASPPQRGAPNSYYAVEPRNEYDRRKETPHELATARDFRVFFLSDGTANGGMGDLSPAEVQRASLATLGALFAHVLTIDELIEQIQRASR